MLSFRIFQLKINKSKIASLIAQNKIQERILHVQLPPEVIKGLVEVELLIKNCSHSEASDEEKAIIDGFVDPLYKCLDFNEMECVIVDDFLSILPILVVNSCHVEDLMRARLPEKYSYHFLVYDEYFEEQLKPITRRNLRPFLTPNYFFVPVEGREQAICSLVTRILKKILVTHETVTLDDLKEYKDNLERTIVSADGAAFTTDGTITGGCIPVKKVQLNEIKQVIQESFEWQVNKLQITGLVTAAESFEDKLRESIVQLGGSFSETELLEPNASSLWKSYIDFISSGTKLRNLLDRAEIKQVSTFGLLQFGQEITEDVENHLSHSGKITEFYKDIKQLKEIYVHTTEALKQITLKRIESFIKLMKQIRKIQPLEEKLQGIDPLLSNLKIKNSIEKLTENIKNSITELDEFKDKLKTEMSELTANLIDDDIYESQLLEMENQLETFYMEQIQLTSQPVITQLI